MWVSVMCSACETYKPKCLQVRLVRRERLVNRDRPEHRVYLDPLDRKASVVREDPLVRQEHREKRDQLDPRAL